ncbi:MAG: hypothetical protein O6938_05645 [Gammaproteobacteria bacterium]|nr:hypothetical protein [Gammaproteobacteria bacterium]
MFSDRRQKLAGILILVMVLITILNGLFQFSLPFDPAWLAGVASWLAALLLFNNASRILQVQVGILLAIGLILIFYAADQGVEINFLNVISSNSGLLSMIAAVGFLRLVAISDTDKETRLPVGRRSYLHTLLGVNVLSTIINISAPMLIADRIHQQRPLQRFTSQSITRVFCGCASWSPFFGAMAVVLTYVSQAKLLWIVLAGLPFTVMGLIVVYAEARIRYPTEVDSFIGYPIHLDSLKIPFVLVICVVLGFWLLPETPVLMVIASSALLVTTLTLVIRNRASVTSQLGGYVVNGLPRMVNELTLFLAAGVLAAGMSAIIENGVPVTQFTHFDATTSIQLLGFMLLCAVIGIHPVILISSLTPLILTLDPNPNLLAVTYLFAWNLGTCSSPLSGTNLVFQGRYDIPSWKAAIWSWPYVIVMYLIAAIWLQLIADLFP